MGEGDQVREHQGGVIQVFQILGLSSESRVLARRLKGVIGIDRQTVETDVAAIPALLDLGLGRVVTQIAQAL